MPQIIVKREKSPSMPLPRTPLPVDFREASIICLSSPPRRPDELPFKLISRSTALITDADLGLAQSEQFDSLIDMGTVRAALLSTQSPGHLTGSEPAPTHLPLKRPLESPTSPVIKRSRTLPPHAVRTKSGYLRGPVESRNLAGSSRSSG
ncbi:uncharacterized protein LAESUDRAFT_164528 [Laetiporus sulphureus 93-53]|uniref:Uncharacterized protein n=1 Tax=Laetiporus sulphureus 93-53 TaxID=1314785 RepID=A0A165HQ68_9APHY|nr:uncharacterized protein LAESUDRAFT_164528 [Laetiporus sulphureus 93-53]KZT12039.1 hypothetical protein LAESUDRAFT_164528 [Laetiporus sulphureus 93-53]